MANITYQLAEQLIQFGLNPREWKVEWVKPNFHKSKKEEQVHDLHVVNHEDDEIYFKAEAVLKKEKNLLKAKWQYMQLAGI